MAEEKFESGFKISWLVPAGLIAALALAMAFQKSYLPNVLTIKSVREYSDVKDCIGNKNEDQPFGALICNEHSAGKWQDRRYVCTYGDKSTIEVFDGFRFRYVTATYFKPLSESQRAFLNRCGSQ